MKTIISVVMLALLTGCAHAKIMSWEGQDMIVCQNNWCDGDCFKETVEQACTTPWQVQGSYVQSVVTGMSFKGNEASLERSNRQCTKVHCSGALYQANNQ